MKDSILGGLITLARTAPSLATVLVIGLLAAWSAWAHVTHAKVLTVSAIRTEVTDLKQEVTDGRRESLEGQLFDSKVSQCKADNDELRRVYAKRVATLQAKYLALAKQNFVLPNCRDL